MKHLIVTCALAFFVCLTASGCSSPTPSSTDRPNYLLIVVDDMGMADLGSFGGEIDTPNLDRLALNGLRLTNFHTSPVCSATRAMLLTGVDNHKAGFGNLAEELAPNQKGQPGHEGELNDRVVTMATLLRDSGYRTYVTGKWHLGKSLNASPWAKGFDRSFTMLSGGASHYSDMQPAYHPDPNGKAPYRKDKEMLDRLPDTFEYSSQFYVDEMINYLEHDKASDKPFFAYLAFTAPHWPLQAPAETIEKYRGAYDKGYDVLRKERLARQKELGIVPADTAENELPPNGVAWEFLSQEEKLAQSRSMEIYAAMIDEIDRHVGRLFETLQAQGVLKDTVIIFISDNGAEGHDFNDTWPADKFPKIRANIESKHDFSYENMGAENSYVLYGPGWARAGAPAFRLGKAFPTEGGTRVSAFVHYKDFSSGVISDRFLSVKDIAPTILEMSGIDHPAPMHEDRTVEYMSGFSSLALFKGNKPLSTADARIEGSEIIGKYAIRKGQWKMVHMPEPYGKGRWELFDLERDLAETEDLFHERPEIVAQLNSEWERYAEENGVILPDWVSGY